MLAENRRRGSRKRRYSGRRRVRAAERWPRGLTAATAPPSRRAGPRDRRKLRLRRTVVVGRGLLVRRSYRCDNWWHGCPLRRLAQTSGSRSRDRHGVIGEMANRSATAAPAIETSPAASAGFPQKQRCRERRLRPAVQLLLVQGGTAEPTGDALAPTANAGVLRCPGCRPLTGHFIGPVLQDTRQRAAAKRGRAAGTTPPRRVPLRDGQLDECFHVEKL
jgi:hypothetical protein